MHMFMSMFTFMFMFMVMVMLLFMFMFMFMSMFMCMSMHTHIHTEALIFYIYNSACLLLFEFIDDFLLEYGPRDFDSVQLLMQPQAGYGFFTQKMQHKWTVEVLDLRAARRRAASIEKQPLELLRHLRGADGQLCKPACFFRCCMACEGSPYTLEACHDSRSRFRTQPYWPKPKNESALRLGEAWVTPEPPGVRRNVALCGATCTEGKPGSSQVLRDDFVFLLNHSYTGFWGQGRNSWRAGWGL